MPVQWRRREDVSADPTCDPLHGCTLAVPQRTCLHIVQATCEASSTCSADLEVVELQISLRDIVSESDLSVRGSLPTNCFEKVHPKVERARLT